MNGIKLKISKPKDKLPQVQASCLTIPMCGTALNGRISRKTGILYFFYDLDTMPEAPDEKSSRVLWYNGELSALHEMILTDYNGVVRLFYGMITGTVIYQTVSIIAVFIINLLYRRRNAKKAATLRAGNYIP